jgi:hypothetical protein
MSPSATIWATIRDYLASGSRLQSAGQLLTNPNLLLSYVLSYYPNAENLATATTEVLAVGIGMWLRGKLVATAFSRRRKRGVRRR